MPAFLTHKIAADNIRAQIEDPAVRSLIDGAEDAYYSGAQGGDYFYSYKYYSMWAGHRYKMFGWALHRTRPQRFFVEGSEWLRDHPSEKGKAFFLGYVTHYALDMYVHPLVIGLAGRDMKEHNRVESALDCMYAQRNGVDAWSFDRAQFIRDTYVETDEIDTFFQAMMDRLYVGFTLPPRPYRTTYAYFADFHGMLQDESLRSRLWMRIRDVFTILKTRTLLYRPADVIADAYDYDTFFARIDTASAHALRMISAVTRFWSGQGDITGIQSVFYNINMNGTPITPIEERRRFRQLYKQAPLVRSEPGRIRSTKTAKK
ncbi:MAG: zinc dependent phospholipase C family protein [Clostridia bacterium]|nr:zinc dependent phospholipase C family protein [Clostridia bacterium]